MEYHNPVLLKETTAGLNIKEDGVYVDITFGGGGHSAEILRQLGPNGHLYGFDQDKDAGENIIKDKRFTFISENFRYIKRFLRLYGIKKVDGILGDFGVSSHQFNLAERGFSTRFEGRLDMRMNRENNLSAFEVINNYDEKQLRSMFYEFGELRSAPKIASAIVSARKDAPVETTEKLREVLKAFLPTGREHKILAQVFQAIRIEVNQELDALKEFLLQTEELLEPGGRLSLISYHSLEDRLVKRYIRSGLFQGEPQKDLYGNVSVPFKKVGNLIVPTAQEIAKNNRARSARLRIAEKL